MENALSFDTVIRDSERKWHKQNIMENPTGEKQTDYAARQAPERIASGRKEKEIKE